MGFGCCPALQQRGCCDTASTRGRGGGSTEIRLTEILVLHMTGLNVDEERDDNFKVAKMRK